MLGEALDVLLEHFRVTCYMINVWRYLVDGKGLDVWYNHDWCQEAGQLFARKQLRWIRILLVVLY